MYAKKSDLSPRHQPDRFLKTAPVTMIRSFLARHRWLAIWLAGAALMLKVLVPAGFLPPATSGTILVQLCSGLGPQPVMMELPGMSVDHEPTDTNTAVTSRTFLVIVLPAPTPPLTTR